MQQEHQITVKVLNQTFQIQCPPSQSQALQEAALYLNGLLKKNHCVGLDGSLQRPAVVEALNCCYELLNLEKQKKIYLETLAQRNKNLEKKIQNALGAAVRAEL